MEPGIWRGLFTLFMFIAFIAIFFWAWSSRRKTEFDELSEMPLEQDEFISVGGMPAGIVPQGEDEQ